MVWCKSMKHADNTISLRFCMKVNLGTLLITVNGAVDTDPGLLPIPLVEEIPIPDINVVLGWQYIACNT